MRKGVFCISIDLEFLWGRKDLDYSSFITRTRKERLIIKRLLKLFNKYKIPATWATVFKLYEHGDPLFYAPDVMLLLRKQKNQEIASHSYTHPQFNKINSDEADYEIKKSKALSFVFPRNKVAHLDILRKYKFLSYRGADKNKWELMLPCSPPVYLPKNEKGLINIQGSMYFVSARGLKKWIPNGLRYLKCKLGINSAINEKKIFHLWFHPVDFADSTDQLFSELEKILEYADKKRTSEGLQILTMASIAKQVKTSA